MKKVTIFTLAILMGCGALFAQNNFRITVGGAMPMGDFGKAEANYANGLLKWALLEFDEESIPSNYGGAGMGFTVGLQGKFGFPGVEGLGATVSVDGFFNGMNSDINDFLDDIENERYQNEYYRLTDRTVTRPKYINVAPMVGLNYQYNLSEAFGLYAGFGVGANFRKITDFEIYSKAVETYGGENHKSEWSDTYTYDMAVTFAFKVGVGAVIANRLVIGLDYFGLGNAKVTGASKYADERTNETESFKNGKINPMFLTLSVGVQF